ncbi:hypothetical protein BDN72DRAFT_899605 [Pluteus cervinus]|uniref:Uncharacterized protein n=1 Tax=Pluteus cervinus TaxID=181527 RepID=A0ACD3AP68_9AGAR|nr:hypothetical protein BDN72DRAFT_899605 [Pluteus cervinus]
MASVPRAALPLAIFLGGAICLLLCNVSAPSTDAISVFKIEGYSGTITFGIWGFCYPSYVVVDQGIIELAGCTCASVGYVMTDVVKNVLRSTSMQSSLVRSHTGALVLYPIATGLTYASFVSSAVVILGKSVKNGTMSHSTLTILLGLAIYALVVTFVAFLIGFSLCLKVVQQAHRMGDVDFHWGNIVWLTALSLGAHIFNTYQLYSLREHYIENQASEIESEIKA